MLDNRFDAIGLGFEAGSDPAVGGALLGLVDGVTLEAIIPFRQRLGSLGVDLRRRRADGGKQQRRQYQRS
jgi:hypothetical protein